MSGANGVGLNGGRAGLEGSCFLERLGSIVRGQQEKERALRGKSREVYAAACEAGARGDAKEAERLAAEQESLSDRAEDAAVLRGCVADDALRFGQDPVQVALVDEVALEVFLRFVSLEGQREGRLDWSVEAAAAYGAAADFVARMAVERRERRLKDV